jgi:competence protein ComEC
MLRDLSGAGANVSQVVAGTRGQLGSLSWQVVWPPGRSRPAPAGNDGSVVMLFDGDGIRSLFLGDLSERAQDAVLATRGIRGTVDLVKVAHHGSADQSARLYRQVAARVGLISVGADNDYGHPAPSILGTLRSSGTAALRTDLCGLIVVGRSDAGLDVWTERSGAGCP